MDVPFLGRRWHHNPGRSVLVSGDAVKRARAVVLLRRFIIPPRHFHHTAFLGIPQRSLALPAHQAKTGAEATAIHIEFSLASQTNRVVLTDVWEQNPKS